MTDQAQKLREIAGARGVMPRSPAPPPVNRLASGGRCTSIAVTSGKGGVGKTTLSLVLAASLAKLRKKVLLMDADLGLANIHILLGIAPKFNISHVVSGECGINDITVEAAPNLYLAPGASGLESLANLDAGRLERLRMDFTALEEAYDYLLMDTGAGIGSAVTGFARHANLVLLVLTPDPSSCADAYAMVKALYAKGNTNIGAVVNSASEQEGHGAFNALNALVVKFLKKPLELYGILPNDDKVKRFGRQQVHLAGQGTGSRFYGLTGMLAQKIDGAAAASAEKGGFFSKFLNGR